MVDSEGLGVATSDHICIQLATLRWERQFKSEIIHSMDHTLFSDIEPPSVILSQKKIQKNLDIHYYGGTKISNTADMHRPLEARG